MKRILTEGLLAIAIVGGGAVAPAEALQADTLAVLDQSHEPPIAGAFAGFSSVPVGRAQAQTFAVGITGRLVRVELALRPDGATNLAATAEADLAVTRTLNGVPQALPDDILASSEATFPSPDFEVLTPRQPDFVQQFLWTPFELDPIDVVAGEVLAIVVSSSTPHDPQWVTAFPGTYASGEGFTGDFSDFSQPLNFRERDYFFRTFVIPIPEPSSLGVALAAVVALVSRDRGVRRRDKEASRGLRHSASG